MIPEPVAWLALALFVSNMTWAIIVLYLLRNRNES